MGKEQKRSCEPTQGHGLTPQKKKPRKEDIDVTKGEILLRANPDRFVLFPIQYKEIFAMYKRAQSMNWVAEEINFSTDRSDWEKKLNDNERHFIIHILAFFAASDGIVLENIASRFMEEIQLPEARAFYASQLAIETVHSEVYSLLIDTYITDKQEKAQILRAASPDCDRFPAIRAKANWAEKWMSSNKASFGARLFAFAIVEGVFFCGSFCAIFWLKRRNILHGLSFSNELIARDESLHTEFACLLYSMLTEQRLSQQEAHTIMKEAVDIEVDFVTASLSVSLIGMNAKHMIQYVQYVADRLLQSVGYAKIWNVTNSFKFMEQLSLDGKTNFFEKKVSEYARAGFSESAMKDFRNNETTFDTEGDF